MFIFRMSSHTVITVVIAIATFTGVTNGLHEEPEQRIYSNKEPFQDQVFLQKSYYDESQPFLLPFSTIVQRTTRNMKDIGNAEHPRMTLHTMHFDHFLQLLPLLKAVNKITPAKPTEIHVPHPRYQVKRSNMDFEKYPNLPFSTLVRRGKDLD